MSIEIIGRLPSLHQDGELLPEDIQDSRIVRIGTTNVDSEAGEFVIEYVPKNHSIKRRLSLLFDGRGMWIERLEVCA